MMTFRGASAPVVVDNAIWHPVHVARVGSQAHSKSQAGKQAISTHIKPCTHTHTHTQPTI
jgi:hypothetical protein